MKTKNFYITTPLYYPSSKLHIGHAYTTILADIFARYKKENNYNVFFLVGSDEHGQKIETKAKESKKLPIDFVNEIIINFKKLWKELDIDYDVFERTTNPVHKETVKKIFTKLFNNNLIYKSFYNTKYCNNCEEFLTPMQITNNRCNISKNIVDDFSEDTYFLKISKFNDFIINLFKSNFLYPDERKKEMINNFIKPGLTDLSVTRISFNWGIKINEDKKHILYVWLDALTSYLSGIKYEIDNKFFEQFWGKDTEIVQFIGKEITRFHSIYWPVILKSLNLRLPNKIISHGWIIMNNEKMSKSLNNSVDPLFLIDEFGSDAVRYFLSTALKIESDNNYSENFFIKYYNNNLVNNYGNLISRISRMVLKYFDGKIIDINFDENNTLIKLIIKTVNDTRTLLDNFNLFEANKLIMTLFSFANKYIEKEKPWILYNKNDQKLKVILSELSLVIVIGTYLLKPIITKKYKEVFNQFSIDEKTINYENLLQFNFLKNINIKESDILFKRK